LWGEGSGGLVEVLSLLALILHPCSLPQGEGILSGNSKNKGKAEYHENPVVELSPLSTIRASLLYIYWARLNGA